MSGALPADHALLCRAVRAAGAVALDYFHNGFDVREKNPGDPVTNADIAVDDALREALLADRDGYGWLSEESETRAPQTDPRRVWVVDPIDGTRGFVAGNHEWAVSAALVEAGQPVAACIFNPADDAFYDASLGSGVRRNGATVHASRQERLTDAVLGSSRHEQRRALWRYRFPETEIRIVDAIAWKLALVADGSLDGLIALRPKSDWDLAAGDLLVREAGGIVTAPDGEPLDYDGRRVRKPGVVAGAAILHSRLLARLRP